MNQLEFNIVVTETMDAINHLLVVKGGEYAGSADRLANFKRGAALVGVTPLQCLFIYLSKHYDAVATFVRDDASGEVRERSEPIDGRLDDIINYCILAKALIKAAATQHNEVQECTRKAETDPSLPVSCWSEKLGEIRKSAPASPSKGLVDKN